MYVKIKEFAQSSVASFVAVVSGSLLGALIAAAFGVRSVGHGADVILVGCIVVSVMFTGAVMGLVARAFAIRVWPGLAFVVLLTVGLALSAFWSNLWQVVYVASLFALPLFSGVGLCPAIARWKILK